MSGVLVVVATIPFPTVSESEATDAVLSRVTRATRLAMVDHVTSGTAIVMPVDRIVAALEPEVPVLVDAAHSPGMVPLDITETGASFTAGNCHKWLCAPKGTGFLHVGEAWRDRIVPTSIGHGWNDALPGGADRFSRLFDWPGTFDPAPWLCLPDAIAAVGSLHPDGWSGVMAANRKLALAARDLLAAALGIEPLVPAAMLGAMATLPLPGPPDTGPPGFADPLIDTLRRTWSIEVPVFAVDGTRVFRISAQLYNTIDQYQRLAEALTVEATA